MCTINRTCKDLHPGREIDINYSCCRERYRKYKGLHMRSDHLMATIDACSGWWAAQPGKQGKDLFGIKRRCEFEAYGKASEDWDAPWVAYITKDYTGDIEYRSRRYEEYIDALTWLCFHISELDRIWGGKE